MTTKMRKPWTPLLLRDKVCSPFISFLPLVFKDEFLLAPGHWDSMDGPLLDEDSEDLTAFDVDVSQIKNDSGAPQDFFGFSGSAGPAPGNPEDIDQELATMLHSMVVPPTQLASTPERGTSRIEARIAASSPSAMGPVKLLSRPDSHNRPPSGAQVEFSAHGAPTRELTQQQQSFLTQLVARKDNGTRVDSNAQKAASTADPEQRPQRRQRWTKGSEMMSPDEIDMIIRIQEQQLGADSNPFLEDYYAQQFQLLQNPRQYQLHRPIMDPVVAQPRPQRRQPASGKDHKNRAEEKEKEKEKDDLFQNVLGRIPSHSVRAPRPLLVFEHGDARSSVGAVDPDVKSAQLTRASLQKIEAAFVTVLELEDLVQLMQQINSLIAHAPSPAQAQIVLQQLQSNFNLGTLMGKRQHHCNKLVEQLGLAANSIPNREATPSAFADWEAGLLTTIFVPKGARVLARTIPLLLSSASPARDGAAALLNDSFSALLGLLLRNASEISLCAISDRHQADLQVLADFARTQLARLDGPGFTASLLQFLVGVSLRSGNFPALLTGFSATRFGCHLLTSLLKRLFEICQVPANLTDAENVAVWRKFYSIVFSSLSGSFATLLSAPAALARAHESGFSLIKEQLQANGVRVAAEGALMTAFTAALSASTVDLVVYVAANAAAHQKLHMQLEVAPVIPAMSTRENAAGLISLSKLIGTPSPSVAPQ